MLKLPKDVSDEAQRAALEAYFKGAEGPLRAGETGGPVGVVHVIKLAFDTKLQQAMQAALGTGHLMQGLEQIETLLQREQKGIQAVLDKAAQAPSRRMSRLVFLANDGSERFLRQAEAVLHRYADRVQGILLDVASADLGAALTPKGRPAKALMIADRKALGVFFAKLGD